ncbi:MAG: hypothetical protein AAGD28_06280 [Bacteroidota bacterium]
MPLPLRQMAVCCLICISCFPLSAQSYLPEILESVLHSSQWEGYFCKDSSQEVLLNGIVSNSRIPLYYDLRFQEKPLPMRLSIGKTDQHWLEIRKISLGPEQVKIKFLYDQRVKIRMKLHMNEEGDWVETSSIFRQKYACGGAKLKKAFSWSF